MQSLEIHGMSYPELMDKVGYVNLLGEVSSPIIVTFKFEPFPTFKRPRIVDVMPDKYWSYVHRSIHPEVINPFNVSKIIALGGQVLATHDKENRLIYVTSEKYQLPYLKMLPYHGKFLSPKASTEIEFVPICTSTEQAWTKLVPWETLGRMTAKWTGDFLVFVDWDFDGDIITTSQYLMIPELHAVVIMGQEAKL